MKCWLALLPITLLLTGCSTSLLNGPSELAVVSQDDNTKRLQGNFNTAYYNYNSDDSVTVVLIEGTDEQPIQAATIRLMWNSKAGFTPINADATNATIQYIVFADRESGEGVFREVGVYSGAGFLYLQSDPGDELLGASLWQADVLLADRSDNFRDLLGQSNLTGSFYAERNGEKVAALLNTLNARVAERLGYPRLVGEDAKTNTAIAQY